MEKRAIRIYARCKRFEIINRDNCSIIQHRMIDSLRLFQSVATSVASQLLFYRLPDTRPKETYKHNL